VETAHGTLINKVRAVLYSSGSSDLLWGRGARVENQMDLGAEGE
jgi:hypothetical protein